jgi:uncharacterized protein (DUF885 family)
MNKAMPRRLFPTVVAALLLAVDVAVPVAAAPAPAAERIATESRRLNEWFERKFEEELHFSPMALTQLGRKDLNDQLDDFSVGASEKHLRWRRASVREMESKFRYALLDEEAKLSWDLWKFQYQTEAADLPWALNSYPFEQMGGMQSELPTFLITKHTVDTEADMVAYIARVKAMPVAIDQLLARAQASAKRGIRPPRFAFEGVIEQARKVIAGAPFGPGEDSALWADMQAKINALVTKGGVTPSRIPELQQASRDALVGYLKPAYDKLIAWEEKDMVNAPVNPTGVGATQRNGKAYYDHQLEGATTTHITAEAVHQLGLSEVARLRAEMTALKDKAGFQGDLAAFFRFLHTDAQFKYPNTDAGRQAYLEACNAAIANIKQVLPRYFGLLPKADLVVKRVEPYREQAGAAQSYSAGPPDGSLPGTYYVHLIDMDAMPKTELEVISYHEALPGHHMQISIAQELQGLPTFRTQIGFTAYIEGWGLYAEWLAKEMPGTYQDPYSQMGRLTSEMWRAVRLVVDTGMHVKGWTEQQAVDYFAANTPIPVAAARAETRRYLVWPGQATAYKVGMLKIQELRRKSEAALGSRFDIRAFHDVVLGGGALPLSLLERRVDDWIAKQPK